MESICVGKPKQSKDVSKTLYMTQDSKKKFSLKDKEDFTDHHFNNNDSFQF